LGYINEYEFEPHVVQSWLRIIKILGFFSYNNQQNILLKLKRKLGHYYPCYLGEYLATNEEVF
jgi:hypothetical protein